MADLDIRQPCVVLVTGASGFLGQHVVGLLQTRADHVTEIRVLDVSPYSNKLDYAETKPVRCFVGSITDPSLLAQACRGTNSVIHVAGITDSSMFPNEARLNDVHINGTMTVLLAALETAGVQRFIYCGSNSSAMRNGRGGICQESNPSTSGLLFGPYASSKLAGENMVLMANGHHFKTLSLRPPVMYGELDHMFIPGIIQRAGQLGGLHVQINCSDTIHQCAYVGNMAFAFVCAEKTLHSEALEHARQMDDRRHNAILEEEKKAKSQKLMQLYKAGQNNGNVWSCLQQAPDENNVSGRWYFLTDDTPNMNAFRFHELFLQDVGYRLSTMKIPYFLVIILLYLLFGCLYFLRLFGLKLNCSIGFPSVEFLARSFICESVKAKELLGYTPLYSFTESITRSKRFYRSCTKK